MPSRPLIPNKWDLRHLHYGVWFCFLLSLCLPTSFCSIIFKTFEFPSLLSSLYDSNEGWIANFHRFGNQNINSRLPIYTDIVAVDSETFNLTSFEKRLFQREVLEEHLGQRYEGPVYISFYQQNTKTEMFATGLPERGKKIQLIAQSKSDIVFERNYEEKDGDQIHTVGFYTVEVALFELKKKKFEIQIFLEFKPLSGQEAIGHLFVSTFKRDQLEGFFSEAWRQGFLMDFLSKLSPGLSDFIPSEGASLFKEFLSDYSGKVFYNLPLLLDKMIQEYPMAKKVYKEKIQALKSHPKGG